MNIAIICFGILLVIYTILGLYIYHSLFDVYYFELRTGCVYELGVAIFFGGVMAGLTLIYNIVAMIIIIILGIILAFKRDTAIGRGVIIILFIIFGIIVAVAGRKFKKDYYKPEKVKETEETKDTKESKLLEDHDGNMLMASDEDNCTYIYYIKNDSSATPKMNV